MIISHLAEHPEVIPILALWEIKQCECLTTNSNYECLIEQFNRHTQYHSIPETIIAIENGAPIGMASLVHGHMDTRRDLSPWLASVYIVSKFRNQGIGSKLVQAIMNEAGILRVKNLYLFTTDKIHFYHRLGWTVLEETNYRGDYVTIMSYNNPQYAQASKNL